MLASDLEDEYKINNSNEREKIINKLKELMKEKPLKPNSHKIIKTELNNFINKSEEKENEYYKTEHYKKSLIYRLLQNPQKSNIKNDLKEFFKHSLHISYNKFKFVLEQNFKELFQYCRINNIKKINVLLNTPQLNQYEYDKYMKSFKEKSQLWMLQHLYLYMKNKKINDIEVYPNLNLDENMDDNSFVLVLDDASYTGLQLMGYITSSFRNVEDINLKYYILVPYISEQAIENIIEGGFNHRYVAMIGLTKTPRKPPNDKHKCIISKNLQIIKKLDDYLNKEQIVNLFKWYLKEDYLNGNFDKIYNSYCKRYPIYFDHKLADRVSSLPYLYSGILPVLGNIVIKYGKYYVNKDDDEYYDIEEYKYYHNFIENCHNKNKVVPLNPLCPYPPYKDRSEGKKKSVSSFSEKPFKIIKTVHSI
tara:strand:- start:505 stop:1764 length:1260 start_codon:yes stop_codon:yes gene_type:complete